VAIRHDGLLHLAVDLVLGAIGSRHKAVKAFEVAQQTHQANPTGSHFGADQVDGHNQAMQEGKPWGTVKKGHHSRMLVEALVGDPPGLQGAAGPLKRFGRLAQRESLSVQSAILIEESSTGGAIPAAVMRIIALVRVLEYGSHSDLLVHPLPV
jgi:hypothetical protein